MECSKKSLLSIQNIHEYHDEWGLDFRQFGLMRLGIVKICMKEHCSGFVYTHQFCCIVLDCVGHIVYFYSVDFVCYSVCL